MEILEVESINVSHRINKKLSEYAENNKQQSYNTKNHKAKTFMLSKCTISLIFCIFIHFSLLKASISTAEMKLQSSSIEDKILLTDETINYFSSKLGVKCVLFLCELNYILKDVEYVENFNTDICRFIAKIWEFKKSVLKDFDKHSDSQKLLKNCIDYINIDETAHQSSLINSNPSQKLFVSDKNPKVEINKNIIK